ncbi:MAG: hypothetical protein WC509_07195 [Candidatus Izemoplasmatales bacterium]
MRLKHLVIACIAFFALFLSACSGSGNTAAFLKTMEDVGYVFEIRDEDSTAYYEHDIVNVPYELDVDVIELYVGYVDGSARWAEVVVLKTVGEAEQYKAKLDLEATAGRFVIQEENIVLITFSPETNALFVCSDKTC